MKKAPTTHPYPVETLSRSRDPVKLSLSTPEGRAARAGRWLHGRRQLLQRPYASTDTSSELQVATSRPPRVRA